MNSKFKQELPKLIKEGVISVDVASKIESYYNSNSNTSSNKLFTIFGVIGSLLIGLGIILILAHNWDDFSKITKTFFALSPLIIGQVAVGYSLIKKKSSSWLESSGTFLFFAVGSSISLVSQIYNIPGNLSSFLLGWLLLCIPLVYLLKSKSVFILCLIFSTYYVYEVGYSYSNGYKTPWLYLALISGLIPFYVNNLKYKLVENITTISNFLIPLSIIISFGTFLKGNYQFYILIYGILFGFLYNIGKFNIYKTTRIRKNGFLLLGSLGLIIMMLTMTVKEFWSDSFLNSEIESQNLVISIVLLISSILLIIYNNKSSKFNLSNLFEYTSIIIVLIYFLNTLDNSLSTVLVNIIVFILGVSTIKKGADKMNFGVLNYGLLMITALIVLRFFDTEMTFVIRGFLFISVGIGFFVANYLMLKKSRKNL